jgi:hypothetical protein
MLLKWANLELMTQAKSGGSNLDIPKTEEWEDAASVPLKNTAVQQQYQGQHRKR